MYAVVSPDWRRCIWVCCCWNISRLPCLLFHCYSHEIADFYPCLSLILMYCGCICVCCCWNITRWTCSYSFAKHVLNFFPLATGKANYSSHEIADYYLCLCLILILLYVCFTWPVLTMYSIFVKILWVIIMYIHYIVRTHSWIDRLTSICQHTIIYYVNTNHEPIRKWVSASK